MSTTATVTVELDTLTPVPASTLSQPSQQQEQQLAQTSTTTTPNISPASNSSQQTTTSSNAQSTSVSDPVKRRSKCFAVMGSTTMSNVVAVLGLLMALLVYIGWTVRNDKLQTCLAFMQVDIYSDSCNATIESGPPSFFHWKRREEPGLDASYMRMQGAYWHSFAFSLVLTLASVIYSAIRLRPYVATFAPVKSMVRSAPHVATVVCEVLRYGISGIGGTICSESDQHPEMATGCVGLGIRTKRRRPGAASSGNVDDSFRPAKCSDIDHVGHDHTDGNQHEAGSKTSTARNSVDLTYIPEPMPFVRFNSYPTRVKDYQISNVLRSAASPLTCMDCSHNCTTCGVPVDPSPLTTARPAFGIGGFRCQSCNVIKGIRNARSFADMHCLKCRRGAIEVSAHKDSAKRFRIPNSPSNNFVLFNQYSYDGGQIQDKLEAKVTVYDVELERAKLRRRQKVECGPGLVRQAVGMRP